MVLVLVYGERRSVSSGSDYLKDGSLLISTCRIALTATFASCVDPAGTDQEGKQTNSFFQSTVLIHSPCRLLRKTHRKAVPSTASASHQRSPPIPSGSFSRNKARESADAALVSTFLAADSAVTLATPGVARSEREKSEKNLGGGGKEPTSPKSPSMPSGVGAAGLTADGKAPKKRSTMNSRDAAYDDAIAMSILGPGSAAMRARLEKATGGEEGSLSDHESDE